jgi:hypothetical protein
LKNQQTKTNTHEKQEIMKKDYTKEIDLGLAKILALANLINRKTELCCFANDVAHCRYLEIKLHKDIKSYLEPPVRFKVSYDELKYSNDGEERLQEVNRCVGFLEQTLKDKNIDFSMLDKVMVEVIESYLI